MTLTLPDAGQASLLTEPDAPLEEAPVGDERGRYGFARQRIGAAASRLRCGGADLAHRLRRAGTFAAERLRSAWAFVAAGARSAWSHRFVRIAAPSVALLLLLPVAWFVHYVYFDRSGLPDLAPFIRFEPPTSGKVYDGQGRVLIELAREYRRVVSYGEVPLILRQAILAAEDKNFLSHGGVDYGSLPRVVRKTAIQSLVTWWRGGAGSRGLFPQGGSTLTQQLVRGYFLQDQTSRENAGALFRGGVTPWLLSAALGVPATNKLLRKLEEVRLTLWLEEEMRRRYGSPERAKREIFARYASFVYLGNGRYGFAAGSEYYFDKPLSSYTPEDAGNAALLAGISKSPRDYAPATGDRRPRRRRNQILALMARNGYIPEALAKRCQAEPVLVAARSGPKTHAPAAIENVFDELNEHGGSRFGVEDLFQGRIAVRTTVEAGGRQVYNDRYTSYSDYNRVTGSLRQPGSAMKPLVYLAAFHQGLDLDTTGVLAEPHVIHRVTDPSGGVLYEAPGSARTIESAELSLIQEGLRGVVRLPNGTAHSLDGGDFPIPVMGKTGTTSDFRDALFVGSTYGPRGITVAVRIGFDDNRALGTSETGGRTALPVFREIMLRIYKDQLFGPAPRFPAKIEEGIDGYLARQASLQAEGDPPSATPLISGAFGENR